MEHRGSCSAFVGDWILACSPVPGPRPGRCTITSILGAERPAAVDLTSPVLLRVAAFGAATLAFLVTLALSALAREAQGMAVADPIRASDFIHAP